MSNDNFRQQFQAYTQWKIHLSRVIEEYRSWLERHGLVTPEAHGHIGNALANLESDRLTIAFVAEVSRGKTELINAIFFSDYGQRLLPSAAGRTTMCPTELLWDDQRNEAYVRLLPIETRLQDGTIAELKKDDHWWVHHPLDVNAPDQIEAALRGLIQTRQVDVAEARRLGLYHEEMQRGSTTANNMVEIPRWRHAVVSFPHPLLKQGLVILDTPGLNALGSEPELTLSTLPGAQAILFVLAADTGVTRSDLEMWQNHIRGFQSNRQRGLVVVLNKIDTLWDELKPPYEVQRSIETQKESTAHILGIGNPAIFPVSAQKGLVAKVKNKRKLLEESALGPLEAYLAHDMLAIRQQIVLDAIEHDVGQLIESNRGLVAQQLNTVKHQLGELEELRDKSDDVIQHLLEKTRDEQAQYLEGVARFQASRTALQKEAAQLRTLLDLQKIDTLIKASHHELLHSWTTHSMRETMKGLFDEFRQAMQAIISHAEQSRKAVRGIYQRLQNELGFTSIQPPRLSTMKYRVELELLYREADAFRRSPALAITEQSFVVKRFHKVLVVRAREIFEQNAHALDDWLSHSLDPLVSQIQGHKKMMEKRLVNLQKIGRSKNTLQVRIEDLESQYAELARQLTALRNMYNGIHLSRPLSEETRPRPRLVSQRSA